MFKIGMNKKVQIIKVPSNKPPVESSKEFPRMPRMYLELLENKDKVKDQHLKNRKRLIDEGVVKMSYKDAGIL
jgi:hypothetical protein